MVKTYIIASYSILIFLFGWFVNPVEISMQAPTEIVAGMSFDVAVTINKGSLDGFARFQQNLPEGFSAELIDSETGTFDFEDQTVKFFWLIIPIKDEITLRYKITTDIQISGTYSLDGIFSYIDGEKKYIEMPLHEITITASPLAQEAQDTTAVSMEVLSKIVCKRQSASLNEKGEVVINILVNRGELEVEQFAKIQELVPEGYEAQSVETQGGIFTFRDHTAKFLWMTLPSEQEFIVTYKLTPEEDSDLANLEIKGNFSYLVNGQTVEIPLSTDDQSIAEMISNSSKETSPELLAEIDTETEAIQESDSSLLAGVSEEPLEDNNLNIINKPDNTEEQKEEIYAENLNEPTQTDTAENTESNEGDVDLKNITLVESPNTLVSYRIQLAAGHKRIKTQSYFEKLKVKESINTEMLDGWYKYTVGAYSEYLQARNKRNTIWTSTPIKDAFVTAYNSGQRITVQEALMISNQTWYQ